MDEHTLYPFVLKAAKRFWSKVDRSGGPDACWPFMGGKGHWGYGKFSISLGHSKSKHMRAHRVAWTLTNGPIPHGKWVLHECDNPPCCNPAHHFLGTAKDNTQDMHRKGRGHLGSPEHMNYISSLVKHRPTGDEHHARQRPELFSPTKRGERNPSAKLTWEIVSEIRRLCAEGTTRREMAERHGVSVSLIDQIVWRKVWPDEYVKVRSEIKREQKQRKEAA